MIQLTPSALSTPSGAKQQHLLETWAQFEKEGGIGKTDFDPQYDYLESKPFSYVERLINNLRNLAGEGLHLSGNCDNSQLSPSPAGRTVRPHGRVEGGVKVPSAHDLPLLGWVVITRDAR